MYKYRINFRYRTANNTTTGFTPGSLEFTISEYISRDGNGEWKNKVKNIIQTQSAISASSILEDAFELSDLGKVKESNGSKSSTNREVSQEERDEHYASTVAANRERREAKEAEYDRKEQESKNSASAEIFKIIDEGNRLRDEQEIQMKKELEAKVKEIAHIDFGSSKDSISNVLDQLVIIGSSKPTPKERKAIFDKMEIGIMKLKKMGESDCSYYEQKMLKIKPTIWQKIGYYFANN